jgi:hypothetical protein
LIVTAPSRSPNRARFSSVVSAAPFTETAGLGRLREFAGAQEPMAKATNVREDSKKETHI